MTQVDEIAAGIYRLCTPLPDVPGGFTFNQFLLAGEEPLLFHTGPRALFGAVSAAVARVLPLARLRWIAYGHLEADECGAMNQLLAAAPHALVAQGEIGCMISAADLADRPPRVLADDERLETGAHRVRCLYTPHVPHGWDAILLFDEVTRTLLCGDLFTHLGADGPAVTRDSLLEPALAAEARFRSTAITPQTAPTLERLAALQPTTLAVMHGSSFQGDGASELRGLARELTARFGA